ncbi:VWA domain-containing protein [Isoalcanivorax beigongshangi]|uniref:VWA domain-containing protein n=1 Tax=Isoalcanivorax beigongshangi TaxID=3238810 RepID=A0ABV4AL25_9GAMM
MVSINAWRKWIGLGCLLASSVSAAHTTEIFFAQASTESEHNKPEANVLFLLDTSGSMGTQMGNITRLETLKRAFATVVDNVGPGVRIGLAKFNGDPKNGSGYGGYVFSAVRDLTDADKAVMKSVVNGLTATSNTPTMESYSEVARYMLGMSPTNYAKTGEAIQNKPSPAINWRNGRSDDFYTSPINPLNQCDSNHIIVMTDGEPTADADYFSVRNITGRSCNSSWPCQRDLAFWLYNNGQNAKDRKSIMTWQVALGTQNAVGEMDKVAQAGGTGVARRANNVQELANEFLDILDLISKDMRSVTSAGVSMNQANRLQHLEQLYFAVFQPDVAGLWHGNLKRYQASADAVLDASGTAAVDNDGLFKESARSFWSGSADGSDVDKGGARGQLEERRLYVSNAQGTTVTRLQSSNLNSVNFAIPPGVTVTPRQVFDRLQTTWGDPLHSSPLMVNYAAPSADPDEQTNVVFISTNAGMLHAIDSKNGRELYTFMPHEMVRQAYSLVYPAALRPDNTRGLYGLDSSWTGWRRGRAGAATPEAVYLFGGMRRGGYSYYGLDVTDLTQAPKMQWVIHGRGDADYPVTATRGFELMGQTWSVPTLTQVRINGTKTPVLVFGGGYDPRYGAHDKSINQEGFRNEAPSRSTGDEVGRAVYMVNAETGKLLWSASSNATSGVAGAGHTRVNDMKWSVPGGIAVVDIDFDGVADFLYYADLGGQVFRVDLNDDATGTSSVVKRVVRLANLGGNSAAENRRFYDPPAVSYAEEAGRRHLMVSIGSGYASHPLDAATRERVFSFRDDSALSADASTAVTTITAAQLLNVTDNLTPALEDFDGKLGWYVDLRRRGEKSLAAPAVINGRLLITTYAPFDGGGQLDVCKVSLGRSYLYVMDVATGRPASLNHDTVPTQREQALQAQTPVSTPQILAREGGNSLSLLIGNEIVGDADGGNLELRKRRWFTLPRDKANQFFNQLPGAQNDP